MTQIGVVKTILKHSVVVRVVRKGACGDNCSMCGMCAAQPIDVEASCDLSVVVGDRVRIQSSDQIMVGGMVCVFLLPILLPLLTFVLLQWALGWISAGVGAGVVLSFCIWLIARLNKNETYLKAARPRVIGKVTD
ncbi:MAG: SoxR reducing system RseC family protein [Clostridia bacterium]|nr:SoxR reducing system RseC family protein [Clostridia bacterium]